MYTYVVAVVLLVTSFVGAHRRRSLDGKIVGGEETEIENYPYQLSLEHFYQHICGASIISPDWALTAAHCVQRYTTVFMRFRAGTTVRGQGGTLHPVAEKIVHPQYDENTIEYDIAVIKVSEPFVYGTAVQPIPLATAEPAVGEIATVTGWGRTSLDGPYSTHLKVVFLPVLDHQECIKDYETLYRITSYMICAASNDPGQDSCDADSGGPMVVGGKQAGVVSWGESCGDPKFPGIYTNIALVRDFVADATGVE